MWFWKKRKIEQNEPKSDTPRPEMPPRMGIVAPRPPQREEEKPKPQPGDWDVLMGDVAYEEPNDSDTEAGEPADKQPKKEVGEDGTSRTARAVRGGMEHLNSPRPNAFDPSKVASSSLISLQSVQIATPCRADWSKMEGDDKSRFCQTCAKSVYNLSAMTTPEAQALIAEKEGNLCARIYRRADGTVITGDCPVGVTAPRRPFWGAIAGVLAAIGAGGLVSGCGSNATGAQPSASAMQRSDSIEKMRSMPVIGAIVNKFAPQPMVMGGAVAIAPSTKAPCPVPTATPTAAPKPTATPDGAPEMGEAAVAPVMGRIACPKPTVTPKPTAQPDGAPEMGDISPAGEA